MLEHNYLVNIPNDAQEYGLAKVLLVRRELIHIKHIFTEVFSRKSINLESMLSKINMSVMDYMHYMTHRMRHITKFNRTFQVENINELNSIGYNHFFPFMQMVNQYLNCTTILDFDGVITKNNFAELYELICQRSNVVVCTANPTVNNDYFTIRDKTKPNKIFACKGKISKINQLIQLSQRYDYCFYIDDEDEYLDYAWIFGIHTFKFQNKKIIYYTRKTK